MSKYNIGVWDIVFYRYDDEGMEEVDGNGNVRLYHADGFDCSTIVDQIDQLDLTDAEDKGGYK